MAAEEEDPANNPPAVPEASLGQTAAHAASVARVLAPLCHRAGLHTLAVLFEMAEQEARSQQANLYQRHKGKG